MSTKSQLIYVITATLREHPEKEVNVVKYQDRLRNGRWGLHAYSIRHDGNAVVCSPWDGSGIRWKANLSRLLKKELLDIAGKCMMMTHP